MNLHDQRLPGFFWDKIAPEPMSGCWLWTGAACSDGYGRVTWRRDGRKRGLGAHRIAYEAVHGPVAHGLVIDHLCRVRCCVNPLHLEPVTPVENSRRSPSPMARRVSGEKTSVCSNGLHAMTPDNQILVGADRRCLACYSAKKTAHNIARRAVRLAQKAVT